MKYSKPSPLTKWDYLKYFILGISGFPIALGLFCMAVKLFNYLLK